MNLFFDIETIPDQGPGAIEKAADLVKVPANYKKLEVIEQYRQDHAEDEYRKTALKGIAGEICSMAWALDDGEVQGIIRKSSEVDLLRTFFDIVSAKSSKHGSGDYPYLTWIGHNIIEFDLRFLKQRCLVNNVRPAFHIPADARHGKNVFDTMREWAGWKGYVSQDALCQAFGIDTDTNMDGSMVWDFYQAGRYDDILAYNRNDVRLVRALFNRMTWV